MATAQLLPNVYQQFFGITGSFTGEPLAGGFLYSYAAGTSTPLATYTNEGAETPNTNPIVLNSVGAASIWLGTSAYKFVLQDANAVTQWTVDNVSYINPGSVDLTKINIDSIAGIALAGNIGTGEIDVQVDGATIQVNGSNQLAVKTVSGANLTSATGLEMVIKNVRDLNFSGGYNLVPQYTWLTPTFLSNPTTLPFGSVQVCKWSPNGEFLAVGSGSSTYLNIYQMTGASVLSPAIINLVSGYPVTAPTGIVEFMAWSPCGDFLATLGSGSSPYINIYQRSGNSFTKLSDPASIPLEHTSHAVLPNGLAWSPNSDFLLLSYKSDAIPFFIMYERSGTTFTDVTTTSTIPSGTIGDGTGPVCWSPDSSMLVTVSATTSQIILYTRADNVFSTTLAPTITAAGGVEDMKFSPNGQFFAIAYQDAPYIALFSVSAGVMTQLPSPSTLPSASGFGLAWSTNSNYLAIITGGTEEIIIYQVSGSTFTAQTAPGVLPNVPGSIDWSPTNQFLAIGSNTTPYIQVYKTASVLPSTAIQWVRSPANV